MSEPANGPVDVRADLHLDVDGVRAHLGADGARLVLTSTRPEQVWAAAVASALPVGVADLDGPRAIGRVADALAAAGLSLEVTGPHGPVATLGHGVSSWAGRTTTGSAAVAPGQPVALAVLVWRSRRREVAAVGVLLAAGSLAVARRRRAR